MGFINPANSQQTHSIELNYRFDVASTEAIGNEIFVNHPNSKTIEVYSRAGAYCGRSTRRSVRRMGRAMPT